MIDAAGFRMIELLSQRDLEAHPIWADFHDERDRARILSWGVAEARLESEIERYDYCGRAPLFPVLDLAAVGEVASPSVALRFELPDGRSLPGYCVGDAAFGVYSGGDEFCLNPSLPARARAELERLAAALGVEGSPPGPIRYAPTARFEGDERWTGVLDAPVDA